MPKKGTRREEARPAEAAARAADRARRALRPLREDLRGVAKAGIGVPPVFIVVCNNTANSELVYEYIAGFEREDEDGRARLPTRARSSCSATTTTTATACSRPRTLADRQPADRQRRGDRRRFRDAYADEIEPFRREKAAREGTDGGQTHHRRGHPARGDEHGRQAGPPRRADPLRRLGLDADRRLGRQHRHPHPRPARLRHEAHLRAGDRPRAPPPVLRRRPGDGPLRGRICRHHGHRRPELLRQAVTAPPKRRATSSVFRPSAPSATTSRSPFPVSRATGSSCRPSG